MPVVGSVSWRNLFSLRYFANCAPRESAWRQLAGLTAIGYQPIPCHHASTHTKRQENSTSPRLLLLCLVSPSGKSIDLSHLHLSLCFELVQCLCDERESFTASWP